MKASHILTALAGLVVSGLAAPEAGTAMGVQRELENRQDSGCFPFEDPDCCVDYAVCQCANGWFYEFNADEEGCNPPWGIYGTDVSAIPGYCC